MLHHALRCLRVLNDLKLHELADQLEISKGYLSEIENGKKEPTLKLVNKYAEVFETSPSAIMFFSERVQEETKASTVKQVVMKAAIKLLVYLEKGKVQSEFEGKNI